MPFSSVERMALAQMAIRVTVVAAANEPELSLVFDGERIVLGRGDGADVRLPDPSVSPRHASLRAHGGAWMLMDHGSTNGTHVGGVRLGPEASRGVGDGDLVRLGRVWVKIETHVHAQPSTREDTRDLAMRLVARGLTQLGEDPNAKVTCVAGPDEGKVAPLPQDKPLVIGRGSDADFVLTEPNASRRHVEVSSAGGDVKVRDLGAKHGSTLNGRALKQDQWVAWKAGQTLEIGADAFTVSLPVADALAELYSASDEVMRDDGPAAPAQGGDQDDVQQSDSTAATPTGAPRRRASKDETSTGWDPGDAMLVVFALLMVAASVSGLVWVLRG